MICGKNIRVKGNNTVPSPSDHLAVRWNILIDFPNQAKKLKIPSKDTAERITEELLENEEVNGSAIFLDELRMYRLKEHRHLQKLVKKKPHDLKLFEKLLALDNPEQVNDVINTHWQDIMHEIEKKRWTRKSKLAYKDLREILKYHLFEKRDGGIITQLLSEDGVIVDNPKEVNELLAKTIEEIQMDNKWEYLDREEFPIIINTIVELSDLEIKLILERLNNIIVQDCDDILLLPKLLVNTYINLSKILFLFTYNLQEVEKNLQKAVI